MWQFFFFVLLIICGSCSTARKSVVEMQDSNIVNNDSIITSYIKTTEIVKDTVYISIPQTESFRTTDDSISHLENAFASSDTIINENGTFFHNLILLPQNIPKVIDKPVTTIQKDNTKIKRRKVTITKTKTITKKVIPFDLKIWSLIGKTLALLSIIILIRFIYLKIFNKHRLLVFPSHSLSVAVFIL